MNLWAEWQRLVQTAAPCGVHSQLPCGRIHHVLINARSMLKARILARLLAPQDAIPMPLSR